MNHLYDLFIILLSTTDKNQDLVIHIKKPTSENKTWAKRINRLNKGSKRTFSKTNDTPTEFYVRLIVAGVTQLFHQNRLTAVFSKMGT